jgi:hypothetical protein
VLAVLLADAGFALAADGPARAIGWAAASVAFAALGRRLRAAHAAAADGGHAPGLSDLGLGGHVGLTLVQAVAQLDGGATTAAGVDGEAIAALSALAAGCLVCARLAEDGRHRIRVALDVTGLAAVAGCAALALDGAALTAA